MKLFYCFGANGKSKKKLVKEILQKVDFDGGKTAED
jgi:hypothetical protein